VWVTDCVGAPVSAIQATTPKSPSHRSLGVAKLEKLSVRDHAVLDVRQVRHRMMRSYFLPHNGKKYDRGRCLPWGTSVRLTRMAVSGCF
jgi:hypothetical protein